MDSATQNTSHLPASEVLFSKRDATNILLKAKHDKGLKHDEIAKAMGRNKVYVAACIYGQTTMLKEDAAKLCSILGLEDHVQLMDSLTQTPYRGVNTTSMPPTDPTLYRFYEAIMVFGPAIKDVIHEEFGDGIMSAIDNKINIRKEKGEEGEDRVVVTFNGKFLPYKPW